MGWVRCGLLRWHQNCERVILPLIHVSGPYLSLCCKLCPAHLTFSLTAVSLLPAGKPMVFPYIGNSPMPASASLGTPGTRSAYKDMNFSPFFSPHHFDGIGFTPRGYHSGTPMWGEEDATLLHQSLGSRPASSIKRSAKSDATSSLLHLASGNVTEARTTGKRTSPSPKVVFKEELSQSSAGSRSKNDSVSIGGRDIRTIPLVNLCLSPILLFL